jgi:hypothetical protein
VFSLFHSSPFHDPQLGELVRVRGLWRGSITLAADSNVPLALSGTRTAPDPRALVTAREVSEVLASWRTLIEQALFEHYSPYADAVAAGEFSPPGGGLPLITVPNQVWPHVSLVFVAVTPLHGVITTELGYTTVWDEEHTLGVRFQFGKFVELCGSVLQP